MQPTFSEKMSSRENDVNFMKTNGCKSVRNLENILLVFDGSCEGIYNDKEFDRFVTAGRHRGIDVIYVKHNLFQQTRWSHTFGSNTSLISMFKSPRDLRQLNLLRRQLNVSKLLRSCLFEILFKCHTAWPTIFCLPLSKAETTPITN